MPDSRMRFSPQTVASRRAGSSSSPAPSTLHAERLLLTARSEAIRMASAAVSFCWEKSASVCSGRMPDSRMRFSPQTVASRRADSSSSPVPSTLHSEMLLVLLVPASALMSTLAVSPAINSWLPSRLRELSPTASAPSTSRCSIAALTSLSNPLLLGSLRCSRRFPCSGLQCSAFMARSSCSVSSSSSPSGSAFDSSPPRVLPPMVSAFSKAGEPSRDRGSICCRRLLPRAALVSKQSTRAAANNPSWNETCLNWKLDPGPASPCSTTFTSGTPPRWASIHFHSCNSFGYPANAFSTCSPCLNSRTCCPC